MRLLTRILLFSILFQSVLAQQTVVDSLTKQLTQPLADTTRVLALDQLSRALMFSQPAQSMQYAQEGLAIAKTTGFRRGEARILNRIGTILRITGNYDKALKTHLESVRVAESIQDIDALARIYNNIGVLYTELKNSPKAIEFFQRTRELAQQLGNNDLMRISLQNIGTGYALLNQLDSALVYNRMAYKLALQLKVANAQIELINLGNIYKRMGRNTLALPYYRRSIPISLYVKNNSTLSQTYLEMAEIFRSLNQSDSAIAYAKRSLAVAQTTNIPISILSASKLLSELYEPANPAQALAYFKLASVAKDSIASAEKVKNLQNLEFSEQQRQEDLQQEKKAYRSKITTYVLTGIIVVFMLIALLLYRNIRHKQKANTLLQHQRDEINIQRDKAEQALTELKATQNQLIQKEKMASLGELTAGIAHEIQNPLNFVNNFSDVSTELIDELKEEMEAGRTQEVLAIADDLTQNLAKVRQHGHRASQIVRGMLEHSRNSTGELQPTDLNTLADDYLRLAYEQQRLKDSAFSVTLQTHFAPALPVINLAPQDIGRVLLNLYSNALYALRQQSRQATDAYEPILSVSTCQQMNHIEISVCDNGTGIPARIRDKIFQPFFTTKPTGEGTGLGLSLSYDIITKGYSGEMLVTSEAGKGAEFRIRLPITRA